MAAGASTAPGHCAFNIYVKDGIVWREEQQGEYGRSGDDTPDYGPRGCQKGNAPRQSTCTASSACCIR